MVAVIAIGACRPADEEAMSSVPVRKTFLDPYTVLIQTDDDREGRKMASEPGYWPVPNGQKDPLAKKPEARVLHCVYRRSETPWPDYDPTRPSPLFKINQVGYMPRQAKFAYMGAWLGPVFGAWKMRERGTGNVERGTGNGKGILVAQEVNPARLRRLRENLSRLHLDWVETTSDVGGPSDDDARTVFGQGQFDRVLVDAPCSNTGVLRRRPDARWRWTEDRLKSIVALQDEILSAAARYVAPGGILVYSTCSNEPEENADRVAAFLAANPGFAEKSRRESIPHESGHDGAFACALVRQG